MREKATYDDLYDCLSFTVGKIGPEMIRELEDQQYRAQHLRLGMYVHLSRWEVEGLVKSRYKEGQSSDGPRQREYLRISTERPKKLLDGLEGKLVPDPA